MQYAEMNAEQLLAEKQAAQAAYTEMKKLNLKLDMSRGKPGPDQLDLSMDMLKEVIGVCDCKAANGTDCRNYGTLEGLPECRALFAELMEVSPENVIIGGASSLNLMFDYIAQCMTKGAGSTPWMQQGKIKFICNVPGYDRHFTICEHFGIEMLNVEMTENGPDVEKIQELVKDESVKGMFCVPKYSNPDGITYSDDTVRALAALKPAAKDFRVILDNAYIVHDLSDHPDHLLNIFEACKPYGSEDMFVEFTSTSKITFPGAGVSALAASDNNIRAIRARLAMQTISYDKMNQLRHVKFLKNAEGVQAHMKKHAAIIAPKFRIVLDALDRELRENDLARWTEPNGGYFISLNTTKCSAKRVGELCREMGVVLTPVGATYPYGVDKADRNIRIAPTYPSIEELKKAVEVLCLAIRLATLEKMTEKV